MKMVEDNSVSAEGVEELPAGDLCAATPFEADMGVSTTWGG